MNEMRDISKEPTGPVGKRIARVDAGERVEGSALYPADLSLPGMLHAKTLRSPHPHAHIRAIDTSAARALPGVKAVITAKDFHAVPVGAMIPMGETGYDMWMVAQINIARDRVYWVGQPVAVVAAVDTHTAEEALGLIKIHYEPLPAVMTSSTIRTRPCTSAPTMLPPSPWSLASLRLNA